MRDRMHREDPDPQHPIPDDDLDLDEFTPRLVVYLSNLLSHLESTRMRAALQLGTADWRVISTLAQRPGSTASEVADFIGVTKALVSRSVAILRDRDLVQHESGPRGSSPMRLTRAGAEHYRLLREIDRDVEATLTAGLDPAEVRALNAQLRGMISRIRSADLAQRTKEKADD